jgi:hypothetical protein
MIVGKHLNKEYSTATDANHHSGPQPYCRSQPADTPSHNTTIAKPSGQQWHMALYHHWHAVQ